MDSPVFVSLFSARLTPQMFLFRTIAFLYLTTLWAGLVDPIEASEKLAPIQSSSGPSLPVRRPPQDGMPGWGAYLLPEELQEKMLQPREMSKSMMGVAVGGVVFAGLLAIVGPALAYHFPSAAYRR